MVSGGVAAYPTYLLTFFFILIYSYLLMCHLSTDLLIFLSIYRPTYLSIYRLPYLRAYC